MTNRLYWFPQEITFLCMTSAFGQFYLHTQGFILGEFGLLKIELPPVQKSTMAQFCHILKIARHFAFKQLHWVLGTVSIPFKDLPTMEIPL